MQYGPLEFEDSLTPQQRRNRERDERLAGPSVPYGVERGIRDRYFGNATAGPLQSHVYYPGDSNLNVGSMRKLLRSSVTCANACFMVEIDRLMKENERLRRENEEMLCRLYPGMKQSTHPTEFEYIEWTCTLDAPLL